MCIKYIFTIQIMAEAQGSDLIGEKDYLICEKHNEELTLVVLQSGCKNRLICGICEEQNHQGQKVTALRTFLSELKFNQDSENVNLLFKASEDIKASLHKAIQQVDTVRQSFLKELGRIEVSLHSYCNLLADRLTDLQRFSSRQHISRLIDSHFASAKVNELNDLISELMIRSQVPIDHAVARYISSTQNKFNQVTTSLSKIKIEDEANKIVKQMGNIIKPMRSVAYKWGEHKAQKIVINNMSASQTSSGSNGERFALLEPEAEGEFINVDFSIKKVVGWVGVGICLKKEIIKASYKFNYTKTFHGSYLVSANGYSWSHSETGFNSSYKGFTFAAGDTVSVVYDPQEKQVRFQNKSKSTKFVLNVLQAPPDDCYVPCVNLCNPGDEVEAVNV